MTPQRLMQLAWGYAPPLIVQAAIDVGVFAALEHGPRTLAELTAETGASARGLRAILDALVGLDLLRKAEGGRYSLAAEAAAFLVPSSAHYLGGSFRHVSRQLMPGWLRLTESVRSGRPVAAHNGEGAGAAFFSEFVDSLAVTNGPAAAALAEHLAPDGAGEGSALDLGAGSGIWGIALARRMQGLRVTALDWPGVLDTTRRIVARNGLTDRFDFVAGDLLGAPLGAGHRYVVIGHVLHSLGAAASRKLLARVLAVLRPGGTVAIAEFLVNAGRTGPTQPLLFAVNMLLHTTEGDTWSFEEIAAWLGEAGFANARPLQVPALSPLILANRP